MMQLLLGKSLDIWRELRVELLFLYIESNRLRWFAHLIMGLVLVCQGIPQEELEDEASESDIWATLLSLLPPRLRPW